MRFKFWMAAAIPVGIAAACGAPEPEGSASPAVYGGSIATAEVVPVTRHAAAAAVLEPRRAAVLSPRGLASVVAVGVELGERVERGDLLVQLDDRDLRAAERRAEAALSEAEALGREAERDLQRMQNLLAQRAVAQATYDAAKTGHERAVAAVRMAEAALTEVRAQRAYTSLRAPFGGVVSARAVEPGDFVAPGQALLRVEDQSGYEATAQASRSAAAVVRAGDTIPVLVPPSDARLRAIVVSVAPSQGRASSSVDVKVRLLDAPAAPTGVFVRVWIPLGVDTGLVVRPSALVHRGALTGLYVIGPDGDPRLRWVETGDTLDAGVLVLAGLRDGDRYAVDPRAAVHAASRPEAPR